MGDFKWFKTHEGGEVCSNHQSHTWPSPAS